MDDKFDVIVLGAGMAGASIAAELAPHRRVAIVEVEDQPGRHTTGRSAAMFFESYGNPTVRALTRASRSFLLEPPAGFSQSPLMRPRSALIVADAAMTPLLDDYVQDASLANAIARVDVETALKLVPILGPDWLRGAVLDATGHEMDVAALHQGYLRAARRAGASLVLDAREVNLQRQARGWQVRTRADVFVAPIVVNATGAWADAVASRAGARTVGLQPMRRTAVTLPAPAGVDMHDWPMVIAADESFYFKPDAGQLLLSPANEDPMEPCDAAPEEIDVAIAVDRFERATNVRVNRLNRRWAGLRSFVADRSPVVGFDDRAEGFFWLAGQGGYGIQMAPALARAAAAMLMGNPMPADVQAEGVTAEAVSPLRFGPA